MAGCTIDVRGEIKGRIRNLNLMVMLTMMRQLVRKWFRREWEERYSRVRVVIGIKSSR